MLTAAATPGTVMELAAGLRRRDPRALVVLDGVHRPLAASVLEKQLVAVGARLASHGFGPGDRIGLVLPPGAPAAVWLMGTAAFATAMPLNPDLTTGEFQRLFLRLGIKALVYPADMKTAARTAARGMNLAIIRIGQKDLRRTIPSRAPAQPNSREDIALILLTSGTTSEPKIVAITSASLLAKAAKYATAFGLEPADRCLNIMPLYHGHGIYGGLLAPLVAGGSTICLGAFDPGRFFSALIDLVPTWYTSSFTLHHAILAAVARDPAAIDGHRLRFISTGSGVLAPDRLAALEAAFRIPIVVSYGLTEAGLVSATSTNADDRGAGTVGRPQVGSVAIVDDDGRHLPPGSAGEIAVKGPQVTTSYEGDAEATAAAVLDDGWFHTGDAGCLDARGNLSIAGRLKEMINRGGEKIAPAEIDAVFDEHPDVEEAAAFGFSHPTLGEEVGVAVILRPNSGATPHELKVFARQRLAPFKTPKNIVVVDTFPRGATGKLQRFKLAEQYSPNLASDRTLSGPTDGNVEMTDVEAAVARIWAEELGREVVGPDDDFFVLGGDWLQAAHVFLRIEEELGCELSIAALYNASTVRTLARLLDGGQEFRHLVAIRPDGHLRPFFCIHGREGNVLVFRDLSRHLDSARPFYALQARGVDPARPSLLRFEDMAAAYIDEIKTVQPKGPYLLGGYSSGGLIAHSMAVQLQERGEKVAALALFDSHSSAIDETASPRQAWRRHRDRIRELTPHQVIPFLRDRLVSLRRHGHHNLRAAFFRMPFLGHKVLSRRA